MPNEDGTPLVLVVDDEPGIRTLVQVVLVGGGFLVVEAADGHEALRLAEQDVPDLVVLDWQMPGMSAPEVLTEFGRSP